jgi:hypothetical protein
LPFVVKQQTTAVAASQISQAQTDQATPYKMLPTICVGYRSGAAETLILIDP